MAHTHTHTHTHAHFDRPPLDEGLARRRDLYLYNTRHSQGTNIRASCGIRTLSPIMPVAAHLRLRLHGYWDYETRPKYRHLVWAEWNFFRHAKASCRIVCLPRTTKGNLQLAWTVTRGNFADRRTWVCNTEMIVRVQLKCDGTR